MVIIFFLFFLIFTRPVFASINLQITTGPTDLVTGTDFPVTFILEKSEPNISYHYKFFGGIGDSDTQIQTSPSLTYNSSWDSFPIFTADAGGSSVVTTSAYIKPDKPAGVYNLYVRIVKEDEHTKLNTTSSAHIITNVITPTPTPTPTFTSTPTSTVSPSPTSDSTIINPDSGIILTEFMPYSFIEWIEVFNDNDKPVELTNWVIKDSSTNIKSISNLKIASKSYAIFEFSSFLNNDTDKIIFINHNNQIISQYEYPDNKFTLERSWSLINGSWCQSTITKNSSNASSCYQAPTSIPTIAPTTITPTILLTPTAIPIDRNLYKLDESATASAVNTPTEETSYYLTPTISIAPISSNLVLGETTTAKKNYLPLIFIITGGLLLISPLIIDKLKKR